MNKLKMNMKKIHLITTVFASLLLTACASGGESQEAGAGLKTKTESKAGTAADSDAAEVRIWQPEKLEGHAAYRWEGLERVGEEDPLLCTRPENNSGYLQSLLPVCMDPVYGILYYVNYGEDYCIYGKKDGKTEKIADIPGRRLFCRDGSLYFIADTYDDMFTLEGVKNGNILQYDPAEGELFLAVDESAASMAVYQDGIYYMKQELRELGGGLFAGEEVKYCYSFSDHSIRELQKPKEYYDITFHRCGEDFILYRTEPIAEEDMDEEDKQLVELAGGGEGLLAGSEGGSGSGAGANGGVRPLIWGKGRDVLWRAL